MTTNEKLDLLITKVTGIEGDVSELKADVSGLKSDVSELKTRMDGMETRMDGMETKLDDFREEMAEEVKDLKKMDIMLLDEIERVHAILDKHLDKHKDNKILQLA